MGRPKGSKNRATVEREAKEAAAKKAARARKRQEYKVAKAESRSLTRGRKKHFAQPLTQVAPPVVPVQINDTVKEVLDVAQNTLAKFDLTFQLERAKFLDGWRQYIEYMLKADKKPVAETYLQLFTHTAQVLGISAEQLNPYLPVEDVPQPVLGSAFSAAQHGLYNGEAVVEEAVQANANTGVSSIDIL